MLKDYATSMKQENYVHYW